MAQEVAGFAGGLSRPIYGPNARGLPGERIGRSAGCGNTPRSSPAATRPYSPAAKGENDARATGHSRPAPGEGEGTVADGLSFSHNALRARRGSASCSRRTSRISTRLIVPFEAGQEVVGEGDSTESYYLVMRGMFRAVKFTRDGRRRCSPSTCRATSAASSRTRSTSCRSRRSTPPRWRSCLVMRAGSA